jgi:hypothetical protein
LSKLQEIPAGYVEAFQTLFVAIEMINAASAASS